MDLKKVATIVSLILFTFSLSGCAQSDDTILAAAGDEIALQIQLDLGEDIGLLLVDYDANGSSGSGGTSHADRSLLKRNELLTYTLNEQDFDHPSDAENLSIQFTIITEYVDPNYENRYPVEYTRPAGTISLEADFGETYFITIRGDRENGYQAILRG